jgi:glycogen synthase
LIIYTYQILCTNSTTFVSLNSSFNSSIISGINYFEYCSDIFFHANIYFYKHIYNLHSLLSYNNLSIFFIVTHYISDDYWIYKELHYFLLYNNIFKIYFFTKLTTVYAHNIIFDCLQNIIYLHPNETTLVFFRLESSHNFNLTCLTIYIIYPLKLSFIVSKIQCFCFSNIFLHSYELIELPVLFYIDAFFSFLDCKIYIFYLLLII